MRPGYRLAFALAWVAMAAQAATGLQDAVRVVEGRYHVRHEGIPGLWLLGPMLGAGSGLKLATFETLRVPVDEMGALTRDIHRALKSEWSRVVETCSRSTREWSVIYMRADGSRLSMLVVSYERGDGLTVVQMGLGKNFESFARIFNEPSRKDWRSER